jgi:hypothetical protein
LLYQSTVEPSRETRQHSLPAYDKAEKAAREAILLDETDVLAYAALANLEFDRKNHRRRRESSRAWNIDVRPQHRLPRRRTAKEPERGGKPARHEMTETSCTFHRNCKGDDRTFRDRH